MKQPRKRILMVSSTKEDSDLAQRKLNQSKAIRKSKVKASTHHSTQPTSKTRPGHGNSLKPSPRGVQAKKPCGSKNITANSSKQKERVQAFHIPVKPLKISHMNKKRYVEKEADVEMRTEQGNLSMGDIDVGRVSSQSQNPVLLTRDSEENILSRFQGFRDKS